ncbi:MAG: OmpA family protein [Acidobacteriia bacterium]|nr:OmpA family protein [Terriglobia bacterium]
MNKLAVVGALGLLASGLWGQGLTTGGQTKDDWEEINFEFNSSILSDGYPSLLRLAEVLGQHKEYRVRVTGHTDYVGSGAYNDKLARARAESVKAFLVKYGASADQVTAFGDGKRNPEVDNKTKEGRFMNRRVVLTVTDQGGKVIKEGTIAEVLPYLAALQDLAKKQEECCTQILKRLEKLDDILAALKNLQGENDKLRGEMADLRNQHNALRDQVAALPKPLSSSETQNIAHTEAQGAVDEAQRRNKKFSNVGIDIGPTFGPGRSGPGGQGGFTATAHGRFFSPFGGDGTHAVQAQGEYMYYPGRQEGQFDIGLVNRFNNVQVGGFASFKWLDFKQFQSGGALGQAAFLVDYIFSRGRIGAFGTKGFKNFAVLNSVTLAPGAFLQTFARITDQAGVDALVGTWGNAYIEGNAGYLVRHGGSDRPGFNLKLTQPLTEHISFTGAFGWNETFVNTKDSGRLVVGLEFGNYIHPKDYLAVKTPVPMDVPRIRYELGTRRVGASPPIADAGPNQLGVPAGVITLDGSGSFDPLGEVLTFSWVQTTGPTVTLSSPTAAKTTFTAAAGQTYTFRLTVKNTDGLQGTASTTVSTTALAQATVVQFTASPAAIQAGQSSTLSWVIKNATSASISPNVGTIDPKTGSVAVSPTSTTVFTLSATGATGTVTQTVTVTVGNGNPAIVRFEASPLSISAGQSSTLSWATTGATTVSINNGVGTQPVNGSIPVSPTQTTTYTLTASSPDGKSVTAPVTVTVGPPTAPQIVTFTANPPSINAGQSSQLCWQVTGATSVSITGVGNNLTGSDCTTVSPTVTTTYTLTATNANGQVTASVTVSVGTVKIDSFTANPAFITVLGTSTTLSWKTENATTVVLVGSTVGPQTLPANGSISVTPPSDTVYTLTAYGSGGQTVSVSISVFVR